MGRITCVLIYVICAITLWAVAPLHAQESTQTPIRYFSPQEYAGQPRNWVAAQDRRGLMYFGNSAGVLEFDSTNWRLIALPDSSAAYSLGVSRSGRVYVGGQGEIGYLAPDEKGRMIYTSLSEFIPATHQGFNQAVIQTRVIPDAIIFLTDSYLFIYRDATDEIEVIESQDHFFSCAYAAGSLYVIDGILGLCRVSEGALHPIEGGELLRAYVMFDHTEKLSIVNFQAGVTVYDPTQQGNAAFSNALQNVDFVKNNEIVSATPLRSGGYAFGSIKNGLAIVDSQGNNATLITPSNGLQNGDVNHVFQNNNGNLWLSLSQGIAFVNLADDQEAFANADTNASDSTGVVAFTAYIRKCEGIFNDSLIFAGTYYDTVGGVQQIRQSEYQSMTFPYTYNAFRFTFASNDFENAANMEYLCYLDGLELDQENAAWSPRTSREFTNLFWGKYTLHVRARNPAGEISNETTFSFLIETPWYETLWFTLAQIGFVLLLLIFSGLLNRMGKGEKLSETLVVLSVLIPFKYLLGMVASVVGIYTSGIAFFKLVITIIIGMFLNPAQGFVHKMLRKMTMGNKE